VYCNLKIRLNKHLTYTVKPVYNDHPRDPKKVTVLDRWSLFSGHLCYIVVIYVIDSGRCWQVVAIRRWSLTQVWLYFQLVLPEVTIFYDLFTNYGIPYVFASLGLILNFRKNACSILCTKKCIEIFLWPN